MIISYEGVSFLASERETKLLPALEGKDIFALDVDWLRKKREKYTQREAIASLHKAKLGKVKPAVRHTAPITSHQKSLGQKNKCKQK